MKRAPSTIDEGSLLEHGRRDARYVYVLRVAAPDHVDHLCDFLRRVRIDVATLPDGTVSAAIAGAPTLLHELRELSGYVTTWNALHAGSTAELVET